MKKVYNIEFTKDFQAYKKGQKTTKFSKDLAWMLVNTLKVAKNVIETVKSKKTK